MIIVAAMVLLVFIGIKLCNNALESESEVCKHCGGIKNDKPGDRRQWCTCFQGID